MAATIHDRLCGVAVPVGALRGKNSIGVGEYPDLVELGEFCAGAGLSLIQILPVNDTGYDSSPYSALTAFALHPLYISASDMDGAAAFSADIAALKKRFDASARFPYGEIIRAKMELFRKIFAANEKALVKSAANTGGSGLGAWIAANPWVKEYAVFRRLKEFHGEKSWKDWKEYRHSTPEDIERLWNDSALRGEHIFWAWLQETAEKQFCRASGRLKKMGIILEGDLPILINEDSVELWAQGGYFDPSLSAGAPPDMYSPQGQNWGFPLYDWRALTQDGYTWWKRRLRQAEKFYQAYRIDHVLGFFRIWASSRQNNSAVLGRYIPYIPVNPKDFKDMGFGPERVRWMSEPHIPSAEVWEALNGIPDAAPEAEKVFHKALRRIGDEALWLFKPSVKGEKDIIAFNFHPALRDYLLKAWSNRMFYEYETGFYSPVWYFRESRAYGSLSEEEKHKIEVLLERRRVDSEAIWENQGRRLLAMLNASSSMLPCAEDLGAVPGCVPRVLGELNILGLRVLRWNRLWDKDGQPYVPLADYPTLSVATPAVHDSSTVREWWEREADRGVFRHFIGRPDLGDTYSPETAKAILGALASAASRFRVFQIQDLLHLKADYYAGDCATERINVPGTSNDFNWTYRLPVSIAELCGDSGLTAAVRALAETEAAPA
ncbi:MAG: 4-alpha-glucanotransferase [Spirochaetaceae bacterium]|jgi:4-alpha-glucanotransferase|nr:4-alpha-glucanotransferase [Spirochaetaceae bacterium]